MLAQGAVVAREAIRMVLDQCEANVFRVAAIVIRSRFPRESMSLMLASEQYFALHPNERVDSADVVRNAWIIGLPRLPDRLCRELDVR